jgi:hypothetical protein
MSAEQFIFTAKDKKRLMIYALAGLVLLAVGLIALSTGGHGHGHGEHADSGHHFHWIYRLWVNLWINNVYFTGLALVGVLFLAIQYAAQAGWSAYIKRIPEAFGGWLPVAAVLTIGLFFLTNFTSHFHIFHWLDKSLYPEVMPDGSPNPHYDAIIAGKKGYLNLPFFLTRMVAYFVIWIFLYYLIRRESLAEDLNGGVEHWKKMRVYSTVFIIVFALSSSTAAWDWVMSIDTHWFSTMFGWYVFSSWFVAGLAAITLVIVILRERGYLVQLNSSHLHDMGKFIFAFSIFWTYIWFSQFLLIYYANIPEETVYFIERMKSGQYAWIFYLNIVLNFLFPFLVLMTRDAKRHTIFLKIVCPVILVGHWFDFYLMITPGTLSENGGFGLIEIGTALIFATAFTLVLLNSLSKAPVVALKHPMMEESLHHHT